MRWLAFLLTVGVVVACFAFIQWAGVEFALGVLFGVTLYMVALRIRYGYWIDP